MRNSLKSLSVVFNELLDELTGIFLYPFFYTKLLQFYDIFLDLLHVLETTIASIGTSFGLGKNPSFFDG